MTKYRQRLNTVNGLTITKPLFTDIKIKRAILTAIGPDPSESGSSSKPVVTYEVKFPFGPNNMQFQQYSGQYDQIERPFKKPLNIFTGGSLRVVTFEAIIANRSNGGLTSGPLEDTSTVQEVVNKLELISQTGATCDFVYGVTRLPFKSFLTEVSYTVMRRDPSGQPLIISVNLQLTEKVEYNPDARLLPLIVRPPVNIVPSSSGGSNKTELEELTEKVEVELGSDNARYNSDLTRFMIATGTKDVKAGQAFYNAVGSYWPKFDV